MKITTIILAAGKVARRPDEEPKILHKIDKRAILQHVYDMSHQLNNNSIKIVYGHGADLVRDTLQDLEASWIEQKQQLGTGHAVQQVSDQIADADTVLILYGDVPLLKLSTVRQLIANVNDPSLALLTVDLENPAGYGRIVTVSYTHLTL